MSESQLPSGTTRRTVLKGAAAAAATSMGAPFVHAQEKIVLRYLGTAVNQDKAIADKFKADTGIEIQYVAVNTDPTTAEHAILHPDLPAVGIGWDEPYRLTDLMTGASTRKTGADLPVDLDPAADPFWIFSISPLDR